MGFKLGRKRYWRNKKTGVAYREGARSNRHTRRTGGQVADGFMTHYRHEYNKRRHHK